MVFRAALLILFLLGLPAPGRAVDGCRQCHPLHYAEAGSCVSCHRGDPRSSRRTIAHHQLISGRFAHFALPGSPVVEQGNQLLERAGCRRCHRSDSKGNSLATDLDRLLPAARPEEVLQSIRQPVLFMPDFAFPEATAVALVNALLAHSAKAEKPGGEAPLVVHFEGGERRENPFDKHCGGCHRLLSPHWGGLGSGRIGPNLSGLTGAFYPALFREGEPWTAERLKKWIENPRKIRPQARMRPAPLEAVDQSGIVEILAPKSPQ
ncbi:MAG: selenite/tellurite reduction operon c-type cytochrome lipoprotein ExtS [Desulfuromonadales bacterium]